MNKTIKNILLLSVAALMTLIGLTGCNDPIPTDPVNIAFIVGKVDGECKFNNTIDELTTLSAWSDSTYTIISNESTPNIIASGIIPNLSNRGYTNVMMDRVYQGIEADLVDHIETYEPLSPEIDLAASLECATRALRSSALFEESQNVLVLYCSGKSTVGLINMVQTPVFAIDISPSVSTLSEKMSVDLTGIDIIWYSCGDLGAQQKLSTIEKKKMREFYYKLFEGLGAKSVTFKEDLPSNEYYCFESVPVSSIPVRDTTTGLEALNLDESFPEKPIVIPEEKICYKPDSCEFLDPYAAREALQPLAQLLKEHDTISIVVYGTCAGECITDDWLKLGKARAESIKAILLEAGIDANRIVTLTVEPENDPLYQFGLGLSPESSVNRKTVVVDITTDLAQEIIKHAVYSSEE